MGVQLEIHTFGRELRDLIWAHSVEQSSGQQFTIVNVQQFREARGQFIFLRSSELLGCAKIQQCGHKVPPAFFSAQIQRLREA